MSIPRIFIAATRQNVGKTMFSLGCLGYLSRIKKQVGYIKPVGQRTVLVENIQVDEDSLLMERVFGIKDNLEDMNPIRVGKGFTAECIRKDCTAQLSEQIINAYKRIEKNKDIVIIEGTGHAGVGSVLGLSNAKVAKLLDASVVMVAPGGIGRPIDEVALNLELLRKEGVALAGVVINKVKIEKYDQIKELVIPGLKKMGIKVLGILPYEKILSAPTVQEILEEVEGELLNTVSEEKMSVAVQHNLVGAMSVHQSMNYFKLGSLIITPGDREDIILAALGMNIKQPKMVAGIILTGQAMPHSNILDLFLQTQIPVIKCNKDTYTVASCIHDLMAKISPEEKYKIEYAIRAVNQQVDFSQIFQGI